MTTIEYDAADVVATQQKRPATGLPTIARSDMMLSYSSLFEISEVDGEWTVTDTETGIFGVGSNEESALRDYFAALVEHRDVLASQPSLSEDLQAQLRYLRRITG